MRRSTPTRHRAAPARFAYADPPYLGHAREFYKDQHEQAGEFDELERHAELIRQLSAEFDGFALHLQVGALRVLLPLCPPDTRVCAWVKPWASMHPGARLQWTWEPILLRPVRPPAHSVSDWVSVSAATGKGFRGAKPEGVATWVFAAAGLQPADELVDLFPGSGAITRAWTRWREQVQLPLGATGRAQRAAMVSMDLTRARASE